jgi:hypothetical protein
VGVGRGVGPKLGFGEGETLGFAKPQIVQLKRP